MWHAQVEGPYMDPSVDRAGLRVLLMDEDRLPQQVFLLLSKVSCGRWPRGTTDVKIRSQEHESFLGGFYSNPPGGGHEEGSCGGTISGDFLKLTGRTKLIHWPETRASALDRALDRQAWQGSTLLPWNLRSPTRSDV
eukprot:270071-Chlamydomonas_euryale.AAC.4